MAMQGVGVACCYFEKTGGGGSFGVSTYIELNVTLKENVYVDKVCPFSSKCLKFAFEIIMIGSVIVCRD